MKPKKLIFFTLILLTGYASFASALINPGDTLNPVVTNPVECPNGPTDPTCIVTLPSGGSVTADNGLTATGTNVQLGGTLLHDTMIDQNGKDFVVQGTNSKLVSGADPLDLFPLIGEAFPGVALSTDGTLTGGVKSYIGSLINPSNNKSLTVVGNFDLANGIQAAMVAEDNELNIYSSDGVSGSSNISLNPGSLSLGASDGISLYGNNFINFNNFGSGRDDSGTNFPTNFLYTDGSGNLQSAPTSLLGGGSFSLASQDEGSTLTSTTTGYNFIGAGVTATESGGLVTVNIPGGGGGGLTLQTNSITNANQSLLNLVAGTNVSLADDGLGNITINAAGGGGGSDGSIYLNDGTLTGNRTLNGGGNNLTFSNISDFTSFTNNTQVFLSQKVDPGNSKTYLSGMILRPQASVQNGVVLVEQNVTDNVEVGISIDADQGIGFRSGAIGSGLPDYFFPRTDGTASQVLTTDGSGQLSWQNAGTFSLSSQDEGSVLTTTTNTYNFTGAGVTATNSGGLVTVNIPNNSTNIYNSSGVLTSNRTVTGANNTLDFFSMGGFSVATSAPSNIYTALGLAPGGATFQFMNNNTSTGGGLILNPTSGLLLSEEDNGVTSGTSNIRVKGDSGITFEFSDQAGDGSYLFPRNIGANGQVLMTNGAGQLSWQTTGANRWSLTGNSGTTAGTNFIGTTDPEDFVIKVNNIESGRFTNSTEFNQYSVFLGHNAGVGASSAHRSNLFGRDSGGNAINASGSNFLGELSGYEAINASASNFIGAQSGRYATNANHSNFFGDSAGYSASEANNSIFIGRSAGSSANFASNSIFLGQQAGMSDIVNNTGNPDDFSILLGNNTSTGGFSNSIAIGGSALNTSSNQFMIGSTTRPIDETKIIGSLGTECTITTGTGMACTSDERLKTNITDLTSDTLSKLQNVRTVSYNWLQNPNSPTQIGFLAQNLEQYFPEMVMTDATGKKQVYYSQMTPILVQAIKELNLKVDTLQFADGSTSLSIFDSLKNWLGDVGNGIDNLYAKVFHANRVETQELCVGQTCLNEQQVQSLLQVIGSQGIGFQNDQPLDPSTTSDDAGNSDSITLDLGVDSSDTSVSSTDPISTTDNSDTGTVIDLESSDNTIDSTSTE